MRFSKWTFAFELWHEIYNNVVSATSKGSVTKYNSVNYSFLESISSKLTFGQYLCLFDAFQQMNVCIWAVTWNLQQCGKCDQQRLRLACAYAQTDQSICLSLKYSMSVNLLTEHHLELRSLKGGCIDSSVSTLFKKPHCWKSRVTTHLSFQRQQN